MTTLEALREAIPGFDDKCFLLYERWKYTLIQKYVPRNGYVRFGMWKLDTDRMTGLLKSNSPVSDADHVFALMNLVLCYRDIFGKYYPPLFGFQPQWDSIMCGLIYHEIGEIEIGDLVDDGSTDRKLKDKLESKVFDSFMTGFDDDVQRARKREFAELQDGTDIKKLFDKAVFVLAQGFFKWMFNLEGGMDYKLTHYALSRQDKEFMRLTKSSRPVDNLYAHFLSVSQGHISRGFFMGTIEAMYRQDFGCEVPETVKQFY